MAAIVNTSGTHRECGDVSISAGRAPTQLGWYRYASRAAHGRSVVDIGCGLGHGLEILRETASSVVGQDVDARLSRDDIMIARIEDLPDKSFDMVTAIDVIEHIQDDAGFVRHLARIARQAIFVSTPNWTSSRCQWPYHIREYTPVQLMELFRPWGNVQLLKGSSSGDFVFPVRHTKAFHLLNRAVANPLTSFPARVFNRIAPVPCRLWTHIGCLVTLR